MIGSEEHEGWEVLLACQGQLRLAPSGHVIGISMHAALQFAAACGHDLAVLAELLPAAEAGLVDALKIERFLAGCGNKLAMRLISFFCNVKQDLDGRSEALGAAG